ncbi:hypothetical protein CRG98_034643 [Punica granatum]|uniref:Uncharacterized protein n=1 Tax=Punica granatum TaxID=22663 RepID=A0A2I0ILQ8_PUNGR|nr:hypothetical protein CRG98_034643 [Punica granatum]
MAHPSHGGFRGCYTYASRVKCVGKSLETRRTQLWIVGCVGDSRRAGYALERTQLEWEVGGGSRKLARWLTVPKGPLDVAIGSLKMASSPADSPRRRKPKEEENGPTEDPTLKERQGAGVVTRHDGS